MVFLPRRLSAGRCNGRTSSPAVWSGSKRAPSHVLPRSSARAASGTTLAARQPPPAPRYCIHRHRTSRQLQDLAGLVAALEDLGQRHVLPWWPFPMKMVGNGRRGPPADFGRNLPDRPALVAEPPALPNAGIMDGQRRPAPGAAPTLQRPAPLRQGRCVVPPELMQLPLACATGGNLRELHLRRTVRAAPAPRLQGPADLPGSAGPTFFHHPTAFAPRRPAARSARPSVPGATHSAPRQSRPRGRRS